MVQIQVDIGVFGKSASSAQNKPYSTIPACNGRYHTDSAGSVETLPTCPYQGKQCMEGVVPVKVG